MVILKYLTSGWQESLKMSNLVKICHQKALHYIWRLKFTTKNKAAPKWMYFLLVLYYIDWLSEADTHFLKMEEHIIV